MTNLAFPAPKCHGTRVLPGMGTMTNERFGNAALLILSLAAHMQAAALGYQDLMRVSRPRRRLS
jgi:hypothetical protein